ncbi:sugar kinase [Pseudonocardia sp. MH-G8]|nr:sugar kinase [Pseudonocardia sp. MH-G8]
MAEPGGGSGPREVAVASGLLREMNKRSLLERLFADGPATRPKLARAAGLSVPTVIAALGELAAAGLVREQGRSAPGGGRPAAVFEANAAAGHVLGIDIGRSWLHAAVADLTGTQLGTVDLRNVARTSAGLVDLIATAADEVAEAAGIEPIAITHTVIGSPGVYDPRRGRVLYAANLPGWQRVGLTEALAQRLNTSLTVDNDANLAAIGEHTYGAGRGHADFAYVHLGTGVGVGLLLDGRLYRGFTGAAGEAGYLPIGGEPASGRRGATRRGMLEERLGADAVVRYARDAGMPARVSAQEVFTAARAGSAPALQAVATEAGHLAQLIGGVAALLDPEIIVVGGGVGQNLDLLEPGIRAALAQLTPMSPRLVVAELGSSGVLRGAIATGVQRARELLFAATTEADRPARVATSTR